jgi:predicted transcriptional regulator
MTSDVAERSGPLATAAELRARRERAGLTQRELAGLAGCSLASVANMEHGYIPRASVVLSRVLRVLETYERPAATPGARDDRQHGCRHGGP